MKLTFRLVTISPSMGELIESFVVIDGDDPLTTVPQLLTQIGPVEAMELVDVRP